MLPIITFINVYTPSTIKVMWFSCKLLHTGPLKSLGFSGPRKSTQQCAAFVCFAAVLKESQFLSFRKRREKEIVASNGNKIALVKAFPPTALSATQGRWIMITPGSLRVVGCHYHTGACTTPEHQFCFYLGYIFIFLLHQVDYRVKVWPTGHFWPTVS